MLLLRWCRLAFLLRVLYAFEARPFFRSTDHACVGFIFVDYLFEVLRCLLVALVVLVLPFDDFALLKYGAVDHLLDVKLHLVFVVDLDVACS